MQVPEFLRKQKVQPTWVYRAKGAVWRVVPAEVDVFVGEDRQLDTKEVSFFCLNKVTGELFWEGISFDEPWWIGIEAVHRGRIFMHGFTKPDMPDHQRILALDLSTGRLAWSCDDMRFICADDGSVFASKNTITGSMIHELDFHTGSTLKVWGDDTTGMHAAKARMHILAMDEPEFPQPLDMSTDGDDPVITLVRKHCPEETVPGSIESLTRNNLLLLSSHERSGKGDRLRNVLKVIDLRDGDLVFTETLNDNLRGIAPDSFFVQGEMIYFVKDRSSLTCLSISSLHEHSR
jgi:hypothetical protein